MKPADDSFPVDSAGAVRVARSSVSSLVRGLVTAPINLAITALILHRHGAKGLGVWAVLYLLTNPMIPFSFGLVTGLVRRVASNRDDVDEIRKDVTSGAFLLLLICMVTAVTYLWFRAALTAWFVDRSGMEAAQLRLAMDLSMIAFVVLTVGQVFSSVLYGLEEVPEAQVAIVSNHLLQFMLILTLDSPGGSLGWLFSSVVAGSLLQITMMIRSSSRRLGVLPVRWTPGCLERCRELIGEIRYLLPLEVFRIGFFNTDKLIVTGFLGVEATGFYEIGARLASLMRAILNTMITSLVAASAAAVRSDQGLVKLRRLSYYSLRYLIGLAFLLSFFMLGEARTVSWVWTGTAHPDAVKAIVILVPSYLLNALTWVVLHITVGRGVLPFPALMSLVSVVTNVLFDGVALFLWGTFESLLWASLLASLVSCALLIVYHVRMNLLDLGRWSRSVLRLAAATGLSYGVCALVPPMTASGDRLLALLGLALEGSCFALLSLVFCSLFREIDDQDRFFMRKIGGLLVR